MVGSSSASNEDLFFDWKTTKAIERAIKIQTNREIIDKIAIRLGVCCRIRIWDGKQMNGFLESDELNPQNPLQDLQPEK